LNYRCLKNTLGSGQQQKAFAFVDGPEELKLYEYSVLVTSLKDELDTLAQHYRDRADCENVFDEIKKTNGVGVDLPRTN